MSVTLPLFTFLRPVLAGTAVLLLGIAGGCTYSHGDKADVADPCDIASQTITYAGVVSPIFDKYCRECHATNKANTLGGGNDFGDYQSIKRYPADALLGSIRHLPSYLPMPQGKDMVPECDIRRLEAWMKAGEPNN